MLVGNQTRLMMVEHFAAWADACVQVEKEKQEAEMQRKVAEVEAQLQEKQEESRRKFLMLMRDGQASQAQDLLRNSVIVWSRHVSELRKERQSQLRFIAMLVGNQGRLMLQESVATWAKLTRESR